MMADLRPGERPRTWDIVRATIKMIPLIIALIVLAPMQWLANLLRLKAVSSRLPIAFHAIALWCMGVRVRFEGSKLAKGPGGARRQPCILARYRDDRRPWAVSVHLQG
jgi:hypothetical protein